MKREIRLAEKICVKSQIRNSKGNTRRFPFDQKFRKFRVGERMERKFSGISFRNFGCTSRGCPNIPENRNNRKILFHSTIPARAQFLRGLNRHSQHGCHSSDSSDSANLSLGCCVLSLTLAIKPSDEST